MLRLSPGPISEQHRPSFVSWNPTIPVAVQSFSLKGGFNAVRSACEHGACSTFILPSAIPPQRTEIVPWLTIKRFPRVDFAMSSSISVPNICAGMPAWCIATQCANSNLCERGGLRTLGPTKRCISSLLEDCKADWADSKLCCIRDASFGIVQLLSASTAASAPLRSRLARLLTGDGLICLGLSSIPFEHCRLSHLVPHRPQSGRRPAVKWQVR